MATYTGTANLWSPSSSGTITSNKGISDGFRAVMTQTVDTGQADWGAITATTITDFYEIFRMNDSLDATYPVFVKVTYKGASALPHKMYLQFGTGSNGAGTLTGASSTTLASIPLRAYWSATPAYDEAMRPIWASSGEGYVNVFGGMHPTPVQNSGGSFCMSLERLRTLEGEPTGDGIALVFSGAAPSSGGMTLYNPSGGTLAYPGGTPYIQHCLAATRNNFGALHNSNVWPPISPRGGTVTGHVHYDGANFLATPIQPVAGKIYGAMTSILICDPIFPASSTVSLAMYGEAHDYVVLNSNMSIVMPSCSIGNTGNASPSYQSMLAYPALRF